MCLVGLKIECVKITNILKIMNWQACQTVAGDELGLVEEWQSEDDLNAVFINEIIKCGEFRH